MPETPTAAVAAGSLIGGYAVAAGSGSRPLGGLVLAAGGIWCVRVWRRRHGTPTAAALGGVGLFAFAVSHVLARAIGAWPSVLTVAAVTGAIVWARSDSSALRAEAPVQLHQ
ncbi:MAG TPA: hypothetical protein VN618_13580 [Solirubrobacteraceae bacterium]|nr:hypothetical protein [Solirubrobacteraceae bacterium]